MKVSGCLAESVFSLVFLLQFSPSTSFKVDLGNSTTPKSPSVSNVTVVKEVPPPPPPFPFEVLMSPSRSETLRGFGYTPDILRRLRRDTREKDPWGKPKEQTAYEKKVTRGRGRNVPYVNRRLSRRRQRIRQNQRGVGYDYDERPDWLG